MHIDADWTSFYVFFFLVDFWILWAPVCQGEEGSLAHVAIGRFFNHLPQFKQKGVKSFAAVAWPIRLCSHYFSAKIEAFKAVVSGEAMYGVVPIENSASGAVQNHPCRCDMLRQNYAFCFSCIFTEELNLVELVDFQELCILLMTSCCNMTWS